MSDFQGLVASRRAVLGGIGATAVAVTSAGLAGPSSAAPGTAGTFVPDLRLSHLGQVELGWPESAADGAAWYTVHRAASSRTPTLAEATQVAILGTHGVGALAGGDHRPPAFGDFGTEAATDYTYVVAVRDVHGVVLEHSVPTHVRTLDRIDDQALPIIAYAYRTHDRQTVLRWRRAPGVTEPVEVRGGPSPHPTPAWRDLGRHDETSGELRWSGGQGMRIKHLRVTVAGTTSALEVMPADGPRLVLTPDLLERLRTHVGSTSTTTGRAFAMMLEDLDRPYEEWTYGRPLGPERVAAVKASQAALAFQLTGDVAAAEQAYDYFLAASTEIYHGNADQPLFLGAISTRLALAYDWARPAWTPEQCRTARRVLTRIAAIWSATHFINDHRDTKASNWVGITRSGETMVRLSLLGGPEYVDDVDRAALALDELGRHLADGYGASGYTQEGLAYFIYPMREIVPAVLGLRSAGIDALEAELARHEWLNLALHTQSAIPGGHRTQFGVDSGLSSSHQYAGEFVSQALALAPPRLAGAARRLYDDVSGFASEPQDFGTELGRELTLVAYPSTVAATDPDDVPEVATALFDPAKGAFYFRDRHEDADDVLIGTFNRNTVEAGWEAKESFGLPILGLGSRWTVMGEKPGNPWRLSKPLVDGSPEPTTGRGRTLVATRLPGQGGGYVELDAGGNYEISRAHRSILVDMTARGPVRTVVAVHDSFADVLEHSWVWQLPVGPGVRPTMAPDEDELRTFVYRREGAWMKGWVLAEDDQTVRVNTDKTSRMQIETTSLGTEFRVVLALGRGDEPVATRSGSAVSVAGAVYDLDRLAEYREG